MLSKLRTFVVALCVGVALPAIAQNGQPIPDFSRIPDNPDTGVHYQDYDKTPLKFTSTTQYVLVPVIVSGPDGKHVAGLNKDAFRVLENGKEQKVASIEEVKPSAEPVRVEAKPANVAQGEVTNVATAANAPRRLVIIAIDLVNTPYLEQARARRAIINYLAESLEPDALYQLVAVENNGLRILYDWTQDSTALIAALKQVHSRQPTTVAVDTEAVRGNTTDPGEGGVQPSGTDPYTGGVAAPVLLMRFLAAAEAPYSAAMQSRAVESTLTAFQQIAMRASGIPGRKSLIWVTGGFPFSIDPVSASLNEGYSFEAYQHTMQLLTNQSISVYPVDVRGLLVLEPDASSGSGNPGIAIKDTTIPNSMMTDRSNRQRDILNTMRAFADMTGGRAYVNTNDIRNAVHDAAHDGSAYYMLSYAVDKTNRRAGWRKIAVKVGDYKIRARAGYFLTAATVDPLSTSKLDIDTAMNSPLDYTGLPVKLFVDPPVAAGDKRKVNFAMLVPPKMATVDAADNNHINVEIAYTVRTANGQDAGHKGVTYNLNLNPTQSQQIDTNGVSYTGSLEMPPGSYSLRLVVRDNLSGRMGSVMAKLDVK